MGFNTGVFDESHEVDRVGNGTFYLLMTISIAYGLAMTVFSGYFGLVNGIMPTGITYFLLGIILPFAGIMISTKSDNPFVSFLGYNMIVIPFGIILAPFVYSYGAFVVVKAAGMTLLISLFMGITGVMFPSFYSKIGTALSVSLLGLVVIRILSIFFPMFNLTIVDYFAAGLFSLYIGYDMYRASFIPKTIDNAIDISIQLYLDIINLFISLVRIFSDRD